MNKKNIYKETENLTITENGEILNISTHLERISFDREPDYIKLYIEDIARLKDLPISISKVMYGLLKRMNYNNLIPVHKPIKEAISHELNISENQIKKSIQTLYESGFLIRISKGYYIADPQLFGKGKWKDIKELQLNIIYDENGRKTLKSSTKSNSDNQLQLKFD